MMRAAQSIDGRTQQVLDELHYASRQDKWLLARSIPGLVYDRVQGRPFGSSIQVHLKKAFIGVPPEVGRMLHLTALAIGARTIVEFGTSFGISAIYLAAAARRTGGTFIGSEIEPSKAAAARENLRRAGLSSWAEIHEGDALETLRNVSGPIDFVLLDGWKDLYVPVLGLLLPKLRPGAVVCADNIRTPGMNLGSYVDFVRDPKNGFSSETLPMGSGVEYSVFLGAASR
jgi:predicted O-methyltransferase YrrM